MPREFRDHFGGHAEAYAAARPTYPETLFAWIASQAPATTAVWDCGTGNGQAAHGLARWFDHVEATDASEAQIAAATPSDRIRFRVAPAEASGLDDRSVDAITIAEALHWFDHEAFHAEVHRVLRPGGLVAAWGYHRTVISPRVDPVMLAFRAVISDNWPAGRELLEADYRDVPWPYAAVSPPDLALTQTWTVDDALAYLGTWSAVTRYRTRTGVDPVAAIAPTLTEAWGLKRRRVTWPLCWKVGRVP